MKLSPGAKKHQTARKPAGPLAPPLKLDSPPNLNSPGNLAAHQDLYRDVVQHSQDIIGIHDLQGRLLSINPLPARVLGYGVEELLQIPLRQIIVPQFRPQFDEYLNQVAAGGESHGFMSVMTRSEERRIWRYQSTLRTEGVAAPVVCVMAHDVTDQKRAEKLLRASHQQLLQTTRQQERTLQELKLFRALLDQSNDAIQVIEPETLRLLDVNHSTCLQLGYSREELLSMTIYDIAPGFDETMRAPVLEQIKASGSALIERTHRRKDGTTFPVEVTLREVHLDRTYGVAVTRDISSRRRTEAQLQASENRYRALHDRCPVGICWVETRTGRFLGVNPKFCEIAGRAEQDLLARNLQSITHPDDLPGNLERLRQLAEKEVPGYAFEKRYIRPDGSICWVELEVVAMQPESDGPDWLMAIVEDITERKQHEQRLREYERVVEGLNEMIVVLDRDYRLVLANREYLQYRCLRKEQVIGHVLSEVVGQAFFDEVIKEKLDECFKGKVVRHEKKVAYPNIGERDVSVSYFPIDGPAGVDRIAVILQDITERKAAEEALRESEARERARSKELEAVLEAMPIAVCIAHDAGCLRMTGNRAAHEQLQVPRGSNFSQSAPSGQRPAFRLTENGGEIPSQLLPLQQAAATGKPVYGRPLTVILQDGSRRETIANAVPLLDEEGKPRGGVAASIDVTELKRAEEQLRASEKRFRAVYERSPVGIALVDSERGQFSEVNPKFCEIVGRSADELKRLTIRDVTHPGDFGKGSAQLPQLVSGEAEQFEFEERYVRPDGSVRWAMVAVVPLYAKDAETRRLHMALVRDITERKEAEEALRQSEQRFRIALGGSPIKVFNQDRDLRYTWVYNIQEGWTEKDYLGRTDDDIFEPEVAERMNAMKRSVLQTRQGVRTEFPLVARGKTYYCDITVEPLVDASGAVVGVNCACVDITHLREISEELRLAKEKLSEEKLYLEETIDSELGFGEIVGRSRALKEVMEKVAQVAPSGATVLLLGDTGTGKELVARAIHRLSRRKENSFIKMNCAAIPSSLLESELFGHEKGAFTGSVARKIGRLELADQGTLFLDEIGELPLDLQPKLLRVLQDREFERLGGVETLRVDFRLVAATNRDLRKSMNERQFRSDLYYRLNVFPIRIPPLRERREDIPPLIEHFVRKYAGRMNKSIVSIPAKTMDALVQWEWPGNIRELENFVERSVIVSTGSVLQAPLGQLRAEPDDGATATLRERERAQIIRSLRECHGRVGGPNGAAIRLGLKRTTLQSKLDQLGIKPETFRG